MMPHFSFFFFLVFFSPRIKMSESFRYIISFMTVQNVSESGVSRFSEGKGQYDGTTGTIL